MNFSELESLNANLRTAKEDRDSRRLKRAKSVYENSTELFNETVEKVTNFFKNLDRLESLKTVYLKWIKEEGVYFKLDEKNSLCTQSDCSVVVSALYHSSSSYGPSTNTFTISKKGINWGGRTYPSENCDNGDTLIAYSEYQDKCTDLMNSFIRKLEDGSLQQLAKREINRYNGEC